MYGPDWARLARVWEEIQPSCSGGSRSAIAGVACSGPYELDGTTHHQAMRDVATRELLLYVTACSGLRNSKANTLSRNEGRTHAFTANSILDDITH
jgi:hypothetical protein